MVHEKKKMRKNHKKITHKGKKITTGAASVLLGAGIVVGANARPVKATSSREDEITEVDTINVISSETEKADVEQRTDTTETVETEGNVDNTNTEVSVPIDETINTEAQAANNTTQVESTVEDTTQEETTETQQNPSVDNQEPVLSDPPSVESPEDSATEVTTTKTTDEVKNAADEANKENKDKLDAEINKAEDNGHTVTQDGDKVYKADATNIDKIIEDLNQFTADQITDIETKLAKYKEELEAYKADQVRYEAELKNYQTAKDAYVKKLEEWGLYKPGDIDPSDISQSLILGEEKNSKVEVLNKGSVVDEGTGSILNGLLNHFYTIDEKFDGEFLKLQYTNLENTTYMGKNIDSIQIIFSGWNPNYKGKNADKRTSGIYFSDKLTDGFFYVNSDGVTMEMILFENGKTINLDKNSAYITAGSLNSQGTGNDYIEKAEIFNNSSEYGGSAVTFQDSFIRRHDGTYGGDVLYADQNIEVLAVYPGKDQTLEDAIEEQKKLALEAGWKQEIIDKFINWDSSTDRSKAIFGAGAFMVYGNKIKIRFSNGIGSAWATYSTSIPGMAFREEKPKEPTVPEPPKLDLTYTPGHIELSKSNVHIHYVDVHDTAQAGKNDSFVPDDGIELDDHVDHQLDLLIGTGYNHDLWNFEDAGYILAEEIKDGVQNGTVIKDDQHHYVYLKHKFIPTTDEENEKKDVNQVIHYVYDATGETAYKDYHAVTLHFIKSGQKDVVNGNIIWGNWTLAQDFAGVKSPSIEGYHLKDKNDDVVGPYTIEVTEKNYQNNLDVEYTVRYVANATQELNLKKEVNQVIHYIYENGTKAHDDYHALTLLFEKKGIKDLETGEETWGEWTKTQTFVVVKSPDIQNYIADRLEVGPYEITVTDENYKTNLDKDDIVIYRARIEEVTRDKVVNQVIHYIYEDGSTARPDHVSVKLVFTQTGVKNLATNTTNWNGEWTKTQTFVVVKSPEIEGYTADREEVGPYDITVTNENYNDKLDKEDTVIYRANTNVPDNPDPDNPTPDNPDPDNPTPDTPTPDPTPGDDEEIATPPLPEDEIGNYPSQSDEDDEEERTAPHATGKETRSGTNKNNARVISLENAGSDDSVTPENVSTEATDKTDEKQTTVNSTNEKTLPATGEEKDDFAKVMSGLAAALGITGLAVTSKRRKATAKRSKKDKKNGK
ncbi:LPXTG cell wall anchor domain-containing protein [Lactobacillus acidophilus]|uniref:mucin-binding protein n=1 Tax=Lactobacillus acidophilus TaxID=1579 RepID=UPI0021A95EED|nr:LPXTG cell wall anchor domain-containing protein [Lactobacillus acidophilus]MCT3602780.1 LPXTG cell wall anchor domain-containing protein [Lactobacillus acidophilus]MCT3623240.1 LPXTG cell wall anchor domain-containing protein [Lactobacillus acidophilus]